MNINEYFIDCHCWPCIQQNLVLVSFKIKQRSQMMKTIEGYTYKINEHIGKGYSSTVHKGMNDKNGENVSIKVIEMAKLEDPINQMLLQHEITALKKLSFSPGVLHLYDVYATKNNTYIVTQLCDGDLGSLLKKRKNIPYHQSVEIIRQIINGYLDVYNAGYLHRDIKPANIFYKGTNYKIGDFGFAIPKKQLQEHKHYNVGSPVYMPPQALKDNIYSVSCDTWAIGIIFFQIIKGVVPWRAISQQKLHQKILTQPLDQLTVGLPDVARAFLSRVLHLDPKLRMTIQEMVSWPAKLAAVEIINQGAPPSCSPLREIKNHSNNNNTNLNLPVCEPKPILTPKQPSTNSFRYHPLPPPPPTQKNITSQGTQQYFSRPTSYPHQLQIPQTPTQNMTQNICLNPSNSTQIPTPQSNPTLTNFSTSPNLPLNIENEPKVIKTISTESEDNGLQQTNKYANNLLNYVTFLHRVVKFVGPPCIVQLNELINSINSHLTTELQLYNEYLKSPSSCPLDKWQTFTNSQKCPMFKTKLSQLTLKHKMFNTSVSSYVNLSEQLIKQSIEKLLDKLEGNETNNEKSIIALDYLTTFYQLWHLKIRHCLKDFLRMSKIDMIVEGNPYNVTAGHLGQIKRKLVLIDILN